MAAGARAVAVAAHHHVRAARHGSCHARDLPRLFRLPCDSATGGLIIGMLLFLVAAGLTLIFGVLKVINFTHGSFYMLGAYFALTIFQFTGSYTLTILGAVARRRSSASCSSACSSAASTARTC